MELMDRATVAGVRPRVAAVPNNCVLLKRICSFRARVRLRIVRKQLGVTVVLPPFFESPLSKTRWSAGRRGLLLCRVV